MDCTSIVCAISERESASDDSNREEPEVMKEPEAGDEWPVPEASDEEAEVNASDADIEVPEEDIETSFPVRKIFRHSLAQKNHLQYLYSTGMKSCSKNHSVLIHQAAKDTGLSVEQVKVQCIISLISIHI